MTDRAPHPIITLSNVSIGWNGRSILHDIDLQINRGDFLAITGPNGGGKTTLLRIILKLLRPDTGTVTYHDSNNQPTRTLSIGYLPQKNAIDSRFPITVSEAIAMGIPMHARLSRTEITQQVDGMLQTVGMTDYANSSIGNLSGGQLQRTLLGRALISNPELLVLDEPLSYLDKHFEQRIYEIIAQVAPHTTILLVSHEMSTIASIANRHIIVDHHIEFCHSGKHFMHYDCCDRHS